MLTISEANAVNAILRLLLAAPEPGSAIDLSRCEDAAVLLAEHANKVLGAGLRGDTVGNLWTNYAGRRAATLGFLDTFDERDLLGNLGPRLTCTESDALVTMLSMHGRSGAAATLYAAHAESDDAGDAHGPTSGDD